MPYNLRLFGGYIAIGALALTMVVLYSSPVDSQTSSLGEGSATGSVNFDLDYEKNTKASAEVQPQNDFSELLWILTSLIKYCDFVSLHLGINLPSRSQAIPQLDTTGSSPRHLLFSKFVLTIDNSLVF